IDGQLVDTLLPLAKWCIYSKVPPVKFSGVLALSCLSKLWPHKILTFALPEIHDCLTALSQSYCQLTGVEIFSVVHVALLHPHLGLEFSSHLPQLLQAIIFDHSNSSFNNNVDAVIVGDWVNDIKYDSDKDNIDCPEIDNSRKEATQMFDAFALAFMDKIVSFVQDIANTNESAEAEKETRQGALMSRLQSFGLKSATATTLTSRTRMKYEAMVQVFRQCMTTFWFALSPRLFKERATKVMDVVCSTPQCGSFGSILCGTMTSANPQLAISQWIAKLVKKVVETKQGQDIPNSWFSIGTNGTTRKYEASELKLKGSKTVLSYHLEVLEGLVSNGHHHLIPYMSLLGTVITLVSGAESPEIQDFGGRLFESVAASLMRDRPSEVHPFSPALWNRAIGGTGDNEDQTTKWKHWQAWGMFVEVEMKGFQRFWKPDLQLQWTGPTLETAKALQQLIDDVLSQPIAKLNAFIDNNNNNNNSNEDVFTSTTLLSSRDLSLYVRLIHHLCHGCGHLGDFDVDTYAQQQQVVKREPLFITSKNATANSLWWYHFPKDEKHPALGRLAQIRNVLHSPSTHVQDQKVSLRTALTRLVIRLYAKLSQFSETSQQERPTEEKKKEEIIKDDIGREFPGLSKVLTLVNQLSQVLLNQDAVNWDVVSAVGDFGHKFQSFIGDYLTGMRNNERVAYVTQEHALTLKRLYFLFHQNTFTTDVEKLLLAIAKTCIGQGAIFHQVRDAALHALITPRTLSNFRLAMEQIFIFFADVLCQDSPDKHSLQAALLILQSQTFIATLVCATPQRRRHFLNALLQCWRHKDTKVQDGVHNAFMSYWVQLSFDMIHLPLDKIQDKTRKDEVIEAMKRINQELDISSQELVKIAKGGNDSNVERKKDEDANKEAESDLKQKEAIELEIVAIQKQMKEVNIPKLQKDISDLILKRPNEINTETILSLLKDHNLPISKQLFSAVSPAEFAPVLFALIKGSSSSGSTSPPSLSPEAIETFRQAITDLLTQHLRTSVSKLNNESPAFTYWRYQLMATSLLWADLRPNVAPSQEVVQYFCSLVSQDVPQFQSLACNALETILGNFVPLLDYKRVLKSDQPLPVDHHFGWDTSYSKKITIRDLHVPLPSYLLPVTLLSPQTAHYLHQTVNVFYMMFDICAKWENKSIARNCEQLHKLDAMALRRLAPASSWFERRHCHVIRDLLRAKWPRSEKDKDVSQWQVSEALWHAVLKAFRDESQLVKEKESQITASEIYAGVVRASHHFIAIRTSPFQKEADFLRFLDKEVQQVMLRAIRLCPSESEESWN
ncbi:hypothetical protein RFI_20773, partial [Reticulomyxa filosa]